MPLILSVLTAGALAESYTSVTFCVLRINESLVRCDFKSPFVLACLWDAL